MARPLGPQRTTPATSSHHPGGYQVTPLRPGRRITMRDDTLPHQIVLYLNGQDIAVSCNCMRGIDGTSRHHSPLEVRARWEPHEPMEVWRAHMAEVNADA